MRRGKTATPWRESHQKPGPKPKEIVKTTTSWWIRKDGETLEDWRRRVDRLSRGAELTEHAK